MFLVRYLLLLSWVTTVAYMEIWREPICNAGKRTCQEIRSQTSQRRPCQKCAEFAKVTKLGTATRQGICLYLVTRRTNIKSEECDHLLFHSTHLSSFLVHHVWNIRILQLLEGKGVFICLSAHISVDWPVEHRPRATIPLEPHTVTHSLHR